ncbi:NADH-quinone oxidoreductase subunit K 1 [Desulfovibrionales bacterium]
MFEIENPLLLYQFTALVLLFLGVFAFCWRRTLVGMLIGVELMLNGAGLSIVAAGQLTPAREDLAQLGALIVMGLAAAEATLILAIIFVVFRRFNNTTVETITKLKG